MRVLAIANAFPKFEAEYEGNYIYKQIESLAKHGVNVKVISPTIWVPKVLKGMKGKVGDYASIPYQTDIEHILVLYPRMPLYNQMYAQWIKHPSLYYRVYKMAIYPKVKRMISEFKPDVIYLTGIFMEGLLGIQIKKDFGIPAVFIENSIPRLKDAMSIKKLKKYYRLMVEKLDKYIYVSNKQMQILKENGFNCNKVEYLPNGFEMESINIQKMESSTFRIVSVGFMDDRKGYPMVLEAIAAMKNRRMKISYTAIGGGYKLSDYKTLAKQLGIAEICNFTGRVSHKEVIENVYNSDFFVLPSYDESFGIAYLEAMACHVPVLMTAGEGISDLMENEKDCLKIEQGNVSQLIQYMQKAYSDRNWLESIAENGFKKTQEFSYEMNSEKLIGILNSVVSM